MAATPRPRRGLQVARTREDILLATARVVARRGLAGASMQGIASEAGFTAPALYAYFPSKEAILAELAVWLDRELTQTFAVLPSGDTLRARLATLLRVQLEWADRRRDVFLAFLALDRQGERPGGDRAGGALAYLRALTSWIEGAARGHLRELGGHGADEVASLLMGIAQAHFLRWLAAGAGNHLAELTDRILDQLFFGLAGPPAGPSRRPIRRKAGGPT